MEGKKYASRHCEHLPWASFQSAAPLVAMEAAEAAMAEDLLDKTSRPLCPRLRLSRAIQS